MKTLHLTGKQYDAMISDETFDVDAYTDLKRTWYMSGVMITGYDDQIKKFEKYSAAA